jgi:sugar phosphate isomerase/epimerase
MTESLHDYIKVGLVHFMAYPACMGGDGPVLESVTALCEDPFFEALEITQIKDAVVRAQVRSIAEQSKVDLYFGAQPILLGGGLDLNNADDATRKQAVDAVLAGVEQAAELDCKGVAVLSGPVSEDTSAARAHLVDSLITLGRACGDQGMPLVLETFDQLDFGKNCLIGPNCDAVTVSKAVRAEVPTFGIMLDLSHLPLQGETSEDGLRTAGDHLVHVHIGNCAMDDPSHPAYGDNHPRFGAPGTRNDVDELAEFLRVLLDMGYLNKDERKVISFEVKPMPSETSEAVIAGSKRTLQEAWRLV